ncbi:hypothetical protein PR048_021979 [Dryococelus australis]|uniref:Uncharacterized protein n=1 Tax=Dryococelus australis TaxID=614101 RepID=A0ABQ9GZR0_9NEOP|nr:hypothetical protein PR048_021979 [Dryococelus australis]
MTPKGQRTTFVHSQREGGKEAATIRKTSSLRNETSAGDAGGKSVLQRISEVEKETQVVRGGESKTGGVVGVQSRAGAKGRAGEEGGLPARRRERRPTRLGCAGVHTTGEISAKSCPRTHPGAVHHTSTGWPGSSGEGTERQLNDGRGYPRRSVAKLVLPVLHHRGGVERFERLLTRSHWGPMRVKQGDYGAAPECKDGGNGRSSKARRPAASSGSLGGRTAVFAFSVNVRPFISPMLTFRQADTAYMQRHPVIRSQHVVAALELRSAATEFPIRMLNAEREGGELFCPDRDSSPTGIPPPPFFFHISPSPPEQTRDLDSHESARATRRRRAGTQLNSLSAGRSWHPTVEWTRPRTRRPPAPSLSIYYSILFFLFFSPRPPFCTNLSIVQDIEAPLLDTQAFVSRRTREWSSSPTPLFFFTQTSTNILSQITYFPHLDFLLRISFRSSFIRFRSCLSSSQSCCSSFFLFRCSSTFLLCSPPHFLRLLASHQSEPGSILGGVDPGFLHVGIVLDDAAGLRVFSGIPPPLRTCIPVLLHTHLASFSSALETSMGSSERASHEAAEPRNVKAIRRELHDESGLGLLCGRGERQSRQRKKHE